MHSNIGIDDTLEDPIYVPFPDPAKVDAWKTYPPYLENGDQYRTV